MVKNAVIVAEEIRTHVGRDEFNKKTVEVLSNQEESKENTESQKDIE